MAVYYITVRGGSVPTYQLLATYLHVHATVFAQEALAKHMTNTTAPLNRLAALPLLLFGPALLETKCNSITVILREKLFLLRFLDMTQ